MANTTPITLEVADYQTREVLAVNYKFNQATDIEGQITGLPRGGMIDITIKALNDGNNEMLAWLLDPNLAKDVKVKFANTIDGSDMKVLEGKGCYCVDYTETWQEGAQHQEKSRIVCQTLKNGPVSYENPWK